MKDEKEVIKEVSKWYFSLLPKFIYLEIVILW